ncbi:siderophore-interacting protein [Demequina sp. B12]|uniref:siderophore-interacting protein n=1 Tax=Demequina sp. B12 TaxID=2992757 RepID=UPI00237B3C3D|nr:siderophore-interacting protein [Demequina sp. B12]MDE0571899.1 siderophore-interacting protein [Demequina sp. B12]
MSPQNRPPRPVRTATVLRTERLSAHMVRLILGGPDLAALPPLELTDHYIKIKFGDVTRTYTIRSLDPTTHEMALDFVVHGDEGLAGPWAQRAQPGDTLTFMGPGGAWAPRSTADTHLLVGDDSALPAIAAALDALPATTRAEVYIEVPDANGRQPLADRDGINVHWIHRDEHAMGYGEALTYAVQTAPFPDGDVECFIHGNADMIKPLRHYLFNERAVPRDRVSISGYWRTGMNEDGWQSSKREFVARMEAEQDGVPAA